MTTKKISATAIVAIRNGAFYVNKLFDHMRSNGVSLAVIDNGSEDDLLEIVEQNLDVIETVIELPFHGKFNLTEQLEAKKDLADSLTSDWIIHLDVDELLFSNIEGERLADAISRVDEGGFNTINFNEFVFLPVSSIRNFRPDNFHLMSRYYFFEPKKQRLLRAYKNELRTMVSSGGHEVEGHSNVYPQNMIMRHYMFQNKEHTKTKYRDRRYPDQDIQNRFHGNRKILQNREIFLPDRKSLLKAGKNQWILDTSKPKNSHFWSW